jgi:hypothetical protein
MENSLNLSSSALFDFIGYRDRSKVYFENALKYEINRPEKASELFWGAVAQSLKALAVLAQIKIKHHSAYAPFVRDLAEEKNKKQIARLFLNMNALHMNFYEGDLPTFQYNLYVEDAKQLLALLQKYYPPEEKLNLMNTKN